MTLEGRLGTWALEGHSGTSGTQALRHLGYSDTWAL